MFTSKPKDSPVALFVWSIIAKTDYLQREMRPCPTPGDAYQETIKGELVRRGVFYPF